MRLQGKIAIVTGAGSGIGKATVELFRREGATVIGADLKNADVECDAGDDASVKALVDKAIADHGRIDIAFANAGISGGLASIFEQTVDDWNEILRVNLIGPFLAIKHAAPHMAEVGGGSIICTASVAGLRSGAGGPAYSASKAGVISLVKTAAQQLTGSNIRGGHPPEIANAALFLASDEASYVNGHALVVDGGLSSSHPFNSQRYGRTAI
jgi:NAD(P)-dependent dehydrogenase (short-subunit alcohol dehydrogenase family)